MSQRDAPLLTLTSSGLYCPKADVYLDPCKPVPKALITHAHSDHARPGSTSYVAHRITAPLLHQRLGTSASQVNTVEYGEEFNVRGVKFSLYPAGHVPGSAQILVESQGERWVFSGDYKLEDDGFTTPIEPVRCHTFISECTFGLPIFSWQPQRVIFDDIHSWWRKNRDEGYATILSAYSLGKAQRVLSNLDLSIGPVVVHSSVDRLNQALGFNLKNNLDEQNAAKKDCPLVVVPPAVLNTPWLRRFGKHRTAAVSGWMAISGMRRRRGVDKGFVLSDHADFSGLTSIINETGAERVLLTHGYTAQFGRFLSERYQGLKVAELGLEFDLEQAE